MTRAAIVVLVVLAWMLACGMIGRACASGRGRGGAGFALGVILGPVGWLLALMLPANQARRSRYRPRHRYRRP